MNDDLLDLLSDDSPDGIRRRAELLRGSASDTAGALSRWEAVERRVSGIVERSLPDREIVVLHALERSGRSAGFTGQDRARLDGARDSIDRARVTLASFDLLLDAVDRDIESFDAAWTGVVEPAVPRRTGTRRDRPAVPDPRRGRRLAVRWLSAAVTLAFVVTVTLVGRRDADRIVLTAGDSVRVETLADGSVVRIQPGSSLTLDPTRTRSVSLDGRAFFDVRSDGTPFVASTAHARVTVLGTTFAIATSPDATEVVLVSGRVAASSLRRPDAAVFLAPGDRVVIRDDGAQPTESVDLAQTLEWTGLLLFRSTPLGQAIERVEAVYGIRVSLDGRLDGERVTGTFTPEQSPGEVVALLAETLSARVVSEGNGRFRIGL